MDIFIIEINDYIYKILLGKIKENYEILLIYEGLGLYFF